MTTTVTIAAHVAASKEVMIQIKTGENLVETYVIQDGQVFEKAVYDDRSITVREVLKAPKE